MPRERYAAGDYVLVLEPDTARLAFVDPALRDELGWQNMPSDAPTLADVCEDFDPDEWRSGIEALASGERGEVRFAVALRRADGSSRQAELVLRSFTLAGNTLVLARTSPRIHGAAALGPEDAAFADFASRLGHDFNNLLSTVIGSLGLLRETLGDEAGSNRAESAKLVADALSAGQDGAELIQRLLASAGKQTLRPERIGIAETMERLAKLLRQTVPDDIEVVTDIATDLPEVVVDPERLETALLYLLANAKEAMTGGGKLCIACARVDAVPGATPARRLAGFIAVTVADTGRGIEPDRLARVLEPLYSAKRTGTGRGLGLSVARGFAHQSGGHLTVMSRPGYGTEATLYLPIE